MGKRDRCVDGTGDFEMEDYVSEWQDWEGVDYNLLLAIHRCELLNKVQYKGSILNKEAPVVDTFTEKNVILGTKCQLGFWIFKVEGMRIVRFMGESGNLNIL